MAAPSEMAESGIVLISPRPLICERAVALANLRDEEWLLVSVLFKYVIGEVCVGEYTLHVVEVFKAI